ncbi:hypothetical protein Dimus_017455 [Dionaea muscipula]
MKMKTNHDNNNKARSRFHGFRLNRRRRRISIQGLRGKFLYLVRAFNDKWRRSYMVMIWRRSAESMMRICSKRGNLQEISKRNISRRNLIIDEEEEEERVTITHTSSFYTEAMADCLEFIKRSTASIGELQHEDS